MATRYNDKIMMVGLIGGLGYVGYLVYKKLFPGEGAAEITVQTALQEANALQSQGMKATYTETGYKSFADQVYEGMRYSWFDDDYSIVESVLKQMKNTVDVLKLIAAYGLRQENWFGFIPDGPAKDLPAQVRSDMPSSRISSVNSDYNSKGINFQF